MLPRFSSSSQLPVPELDERLVAVELLHRPGEIVERERLVDDVGAGLEQNAAELAALTQRLQRSVEAAKDLCAQLPGGRSTRPRSSTGIASRRSSGSGRP